MNDVSRPKKHLYQFAHRMLPERFFADPGGTVTRLSQPGGLEWLQRQWLDLGEVFPTEALPVTGLAYDFEPMPGTSLVIIAFPAALAPMEPIHVALAHRAAVTRMLVFAAPAESRYFVHERGRGPNDAVASEWLPSGARGAEVPVASTREAFLAWLNAELR